MAGRRAVLRTLALEDIDHAIARLRREASDTVALRFIGALEQTIGRALRLPHAGSLKFAYELGIPDLRAVPLKRFPYVVFYIPLDDGIDIWRLLHARRDLPHAFHEHTDRSE